MSAGSLVHTHTKEIQNFVVFFFFQFIILPYAANSFLLNFALSAAYFISKSMFDELPPEKKNVFKEWHLGGKIKKIGRGATSTTFYLKKKWTHSFASDTASLMTFTILLPAPEKHYRVGGTVWPSSHSCPSRYQTSPIRLFFGNKAILFQCFQELHLYTLLKSVPCTSNCISF